MEENQISLKDMRYQAGTSFHVGYSPTTKLYTLHYTKSMPPQYVGIYTRTRELLDIVKIVKKQNGE